MKKGIHATFESINKPMLILIILFGLFLRLINLLWGINEISAYDVDGFTNLTVVFRMGINRDPNPHFFEKPTLFYYILSIIFIGVYFVSGVLIFSQYALISRVVVLFFSLSTIVAIYKLGKAIYNEQVGLIAAFLLAITEVHVRYSYHIVPDNPLTFFVTMSILYLVYIVKYKTTKNYLLAGLFIGLAATTKYPGGLLFFFLFITHLISEEKRTYRILLDRRLLYSVAISLLSVISGTPFAILSFNEFYEQLVWIYFYQLTGHIGQEHDTPLKWIELLFFGLGMWLFVISVLALGYSIIKLRKTLKNNKSEVLLVLWIIGFLLVLFTFKARFVRYLLPIFPPLLVITSKFLYLDSSMFEKMHAKLKINPVKILTVLIIIFSFTYTLGTEIVQIRDNRDYVSMWMEENIPKEAIIAYSPYIVIPRQFNNIYNLPWLGTNVSFNWLEQIHAEYLVVSDIYENYLISSDVHANETLFYKNLIEGNSSYVEIERFVPVLDRHDKDGFLNLATFGISSIILFLEYPNEPVGGPTIIIYKRF